MTHRRPSVRSCRCRLALVRTTLILIFLFSLAKVNGAEKPEGFARKIRPVLKQYCFPCHSSEKHKGDFDMERFGSLADVKHQPKIWQRVAEQLANNEMPPEEKPQPSPDEKSRITSWLSGVLSEVARERAGDPGPVVLRRLSNAEYTYTIQDLTGVDSLQPAREFPVDGAAGEGFMNTGQALVMSPALVTKYLDAAKDIAGHMVLLPDGMRFSAKTTRRDWTAEIMKEIRDFYAQFADAKGAEKVNLQGIVFETNEGGRLPVEPYLAAALFAQDSARGKMSVDELARQRGLNAKYLENLVAMLQAKGPSLLLDSLRARWRGAKTNEAAAIATEVAHWQKALWKFNTVGHIGKLNGPKSWMEPLNPLVSHQDFRIKLPTAPDNTEVTLYLVASDAGDGNEKDFVIWDRPRLVAPGAPDLSLRDARDIGGELTQRRERVFAHTAKVLEISADAAAGSTPIDVAAVAGRTGIDADSLGAWLRYLGVGATNGVAIDSYFTNHLTKLSNYDFINGWGSSDTPLMVANSSDQHVRIPGNMKPQSIAVHPSPTLAACVGWSSPISGTMRIQASVTHAHPECGNGVTWALELRRGPTRQRFASGTAQGGSEVKIGPFENVAIQQGDLISVLIGPRDGNHSCDLTAVDLTLTSRDENGRTWDLAADVSPDVLAANPHADKLGNAGVWHFYTEPDNSTVTRIPASSLLAKWQSTPSAAEKSKLANELEKMLASGVKPVSGPDAELYQQLTSFRGPLFQGIATAEKSPLAGSTTTPASQPSWGLDPERFGRHPNGESREAASLCVRAPSVIEIQLPASLVAGCEFVTSGRLDPATGAEGSVQLQVLTNKPSARAGLIAGTVTETLNNAVWTSDNRQISDDTPIVVVDGSQARKRMEAAFDDFRRWFPAALCYAKIVPVDEAITLTLFHREDEPLARLMLDDAQKAKLDRLWDQLRYVSQDALTLVDAFEQLWQYATQDADPKVFEPLRKPIQDGAAALRKRLKETEPMHVQAVLDLATRAYRRPVTAGEREELLGLYRKFRDEELSHDEAVRLMMARVLVAPAFLYRAETPGPGKTQGPLNDWELANRLSYFLWSSMPDAELSAAAAAGKLHQPKILAAQTERMLVDARVRRLAIEFACQWLHVRDFDTLDEKSERHFPTFGALRSPMYEETIRFFADLFQSNGSVLAILDADYSFLNEPLAKHYGIPGVTGEEWRKVSGMKKFSRGGILGQATVLAKQSGASRTSPILRGNWVAEALLGDKLPRPPKDVPRLPEDEATENLTVRQLTEKHTTDPRCAGCHVRIDAFGFALEEFDSIGRYRERDLGDRPIDARAKIKDGTELDGFNGLRSYLVTKRRDDFLKQFCRKLLGYSLGRSVQLSDEPLLTQMREKLKANGYHFDTAIDSIVMSRQFREIRGKEMAYDD
jgi:hypothetical protein